MKTIGYLLHPGMPSALEAAANLEKVAASRGLRAVEVEVAGGDRADVVIGLGGDGTILRAAQAALRMDVPLLGANLGKLGFLSTMEVDRLEEVVDGLIAGNHSVTNRLILEATASWGDRVNEPVLALNEIVLERGTLSRVVSIELSVGAEHVAKYTSDGFIVATPTGSTGYSLSAGGPVVEPQVEAMVLTSVSAHSPLWRSIVVGPDQVVTLETPRDAVAFSTDGRAVEILEAGSRVVVRKYGRYLRMISFGGPRFYKKLRSRFHLDH